MTAVLIFGLSLLFGGLLFAWKTGSFALHSFIEPDSTESMYYLTRPHLYSLLLSHLPWTGGACMTAAAIKYFIRRRGNPEN